MLIMPSIQKSLIVEQFQGNYLNCQRDTISKKEMVFRFRNGKGRKKIKYCSVGHLACHIYFASSIETL